MKNLYRITNKNGTFLCLWAANNEADAVESVKRDLGFKSASAAILVNRD